MLKGFGHGIAETASSAKDALGTVGESIGGAAGSVKEGAGRVIEGAGSGLSKVGSNVKKGFSSLAETASKGFESGRDAWSGTFEKHPLILCAAVVAAGAAAGFLLPRTKAEDRALGK